MWGRAPLITDAASWHVHLGTQQMEASLTPRRERNPSMDFAHTGSLMSSEVRVQHNFSRQHGRAREKIEHLDRAIDQEIAWYVLPAYAENANKKVRYLSVAFGASSPPALLFFRFAFLSSSSHSSSSIILTTLMPMPMSPCIRNSTPRFCR